MSSSSPAGRTSLRSILSAVAVGGAACGGGLDLDDDFDIPRTEDFAANLSAYGLYAGVPSDLVPAAGVARYELSSPLFTDYALKQRLLKLPEGEAMQIGPGPNPELPEGTIVAKTFYYDADFRDPSLGRRVIETRLLVLRAGQWSSATYIWNEAQTDAVVSLDGATTEVAWISADGVARRTEYEIPDEVACVTCHQSNDDVALLGVGLDHLNRNVERDGRRVNQWSHLQDLGAVAPADVSTLPRIVDYRDPSASLEDRARAYLDINCAHCHNPTAWDRPAGQGLDLRYATPIAETGIADEANRMRRLVEDGEMPYVGTTLLHTEGLELLSEYLDAIGRGR